MEGWFCKHGPNAHREHAGDRATARTNQRPRMQQVDLFAMAGIPQKHDPGGKVRLALGRDVKSSAVFGGPDDCYRYRLVRTWDKTKPHAMFIMMNPRTGLINV